LFFCSPLANEKFVIDKKESVVTWKGSGLFASEQQRTGYIYISKGELNVMKN
jgi:hypothetical protein